MKYVFIDIQLISARVHTGHDCYRCAASTRLKAGTYQAHSRHTRVRNQRSGQDGRFLWRLTISNSAYGKSACIINYRRLTYIQKYRQCSGRAGRRGFDLLGNVVFYGLPMDRVQRMVLSKLPALGGNFPLTSTLSLRLMNLLNGSGDAKFAMDAVKSILSMPQISFISDMGREQVLHHMRFSIEYLRRSGLLDRNGQPMNLFSLAAHLYVRLLFSGSAASAQF
jgi:hypothetical protein